MNALNKPINEFRFEVFADGGNLTDDEMSALLNDKMYSIEVENVLLSRIKHHKNDINHLLNNDETAKNKIAELGITKILDMIFEDVAMIHAINDLRKNNE